MYCSIYAAVEPAVLKTYEAYDRKRDKDDRKKREYREDFSKK